MINSVKLNSISQNYGEVQALININLEIKDGEFFSLLGPSGSGKTTCLRIIAGFESPNQGAVFLFNEDVTIVDNFSKDEYAICWFSVPRFEQRTASHESKSSIIGSPPSTNFWAILFNVSIAIIGLIGCGCSSPIPVGSKSNNNNVCKLCFLFIKITSNGDVGKYVL